jgi:D-lactate dehydrogenase
VRRKFETKNTSGYSLNAFLDFDSPALILAHLMVGSEGTLGFVSELTLRTVPEPPARATALVLFAELEDAGRAVAPLAQAGADALEILDAASLRAIAAEHPFSFEVGEAGSGAARRAAPRRRGTLASAVDDVRAILKSTAWSSQSASRPGRRSARALAPAQGSRLAAGAMRPSGTAF